MQCFTLMGSANLTRSAAVGGIDDTDDIQLRDLAAELLCYIAQPILIGKSSGFDGA